MKRQKNNDEALNGLLSKVERLVVSRNAALDHFTYYRYDSQIKRLQKQIDQLRKGRRARRIQIEKENERWY